MKLNSRILSSQRLLILHRETISTELQAQTNTICQALTHASIHSHVIKLSTELITVSNSTSLPPFQRYFNHLFKDNTLKESFICMHIHTQIHALNSICSFLHLPDTRYCLSTFQRIFTENKLSIAQFCFHFSQVQMGHWANDTTVLDLVY